MGDKPGYGRPRSWREGDQTPEAQVRRAKKSRRKKLLVVSALLLTLAGATAALLWMIRPVPDVVFFPVSVTQYQMKPNGYGKYSGLNPMAEMDRKALYDHVKWKRDRLFQFATPEAAVNPWAAQYNSDALEGKLLKLQNDMRTDPQPVVIYLNAFARVRNGSIVLLFSDSLTDSPDTGIPFKKFLTELARVGKDQAEQPMPKVQKLLILDITRPLLDSRRGVLNTDVAALIPQELQQVGDDQRIVLTACAPGQVSLMAEELGRSAFAYYVEQGLLGYADGWDPKDPANRKKDGISARELAHYVQFHVDRWARKSRDARQTPQMFAPNETLDFNLTTALNRPPMAPAAATSAQPVLRWEDSFRVIASSAPELYGAYPVRWWQLHDEWLRDDVLADSPEALAYLQIHLLDIELRWRNGEPVEVLDKVWEDTLKVAREMRAKSARERRPVTGRAQMPSLAVFLREQVRSRNRTVDQKWVMGLQREAVNFDIDMKRRLPRPSEAAKEADYARQLMEKAEEYAKDVFANLYKKAEMEPLGIKPYPDFLAAVWEAVLTEKNPTPARLRLYHAVLGLKELRNAEGIPDEVARRDRTNVEVAFLERVLALPNLYQPEMLDVLRPALEVLKAGEEALAVEDPGTFVWLQRPLQEAVRLRHQADVMLFSPGYMRLDQVKKKYEEARESYRVLNDRRITLRTARRNSQEALAHLPYHAAYFQALPPSRRSAQAEQQIISLVAAVQRLHQQLMPPPKLLELGDARLEEHFARVKAGSREVEDLLRGLRKPLSNLPGEENLLRLLEALKNNKSAADLLEATALLELPDFASSDRKRVWEVREEILDKLRKERAAEDGKRTETLPPMPAAEPDPDVLARTLLAARLGKELLRLAPNLSPYTGAETALRKSLGAAETAKTPEALSAALQETGDALLRHWTEAGRLKFENDYQADWLARVHYIGKAAYTEDNQPPSMKLHQADREQMHSCLGQIYQYLAWEWEQWPRDATETRMLAQVYRDEANYQKQGTPQEVPLSTARLNADDLTPVELDGRSKTVSFRPVPVGKEVSIVVLSDDSILSGRTDTERGELTLDLRSLQERPEGFIVQVTVDGWPYHFHRKVTVSERGLPGPELRFAMSPAAAPDVLFSASLDLRAIDQQPVYVHVRNPTPKPRRVIVKVRYGDNVECESEPEDVPAQETKPIRFKKKPARGEMLQWDSDVRPRPVLAFELYELEGSNIRLLEKATVEPRPRVMEPSEFLQAEAEYLPPKDGQGASLVLNFRTVEGHRLSRKCDLVVTLPKDRNPGLSRANTAFTARGVLEPDMPSVQIELRDVKLDYDTRLEAHVQVDGYARGFIVVFTETSSSERVKGKTLHTREKRVRIAGDRRYIASDKPFQAMLETDKVQDAEFVRLRWSDRANSATGEMEKRAGSRHTVITMDVNVPDGLLQFTAKAEDHRIRKQLDLGSGRRFLSVDVVTGNDAPVRADTPPEVEIQIDPKDPEVSVESMSLPSRTSEELVIRVKAADAHSGVKKVLVYRGAFTDGKPPAGVKAEEAVQEYGTDFWVARVPVTLSDAMVLFTVEATDGAERQKAAERSFDVAAARNVPQTAALGSVRIKAILSPANVPARGADVFIVLMDEATKQPKKIIADGKADPNGLCEFKEIPPGTYTIAARSKDNFGMAQGQLEGVVIKPGDNGLKQVVLSR